jgi:hypothetical protein
MPKAVIETIVWFGKEERFVERMRRREMCI